MFPVQVVLAATSSVQHVRLALFVSLPLPCAQLLEAVAQDGHALRYAASNLRSDPDFALLCCHILWTKVVGSYTMFHTVAAKSSVAN